MGIYLFFVLYPHPSKTKRNISYIEILGKSGGDFVDQLLFKSDSVPVYEHHFICDCLSCNRPLKRKSESLR